MWSIGCIAAELLLRTPLLQGTSDLDQLSKTFEVLGSPTKENWPDVDQLPDYVEFRPSPGFPLEEIFSAAGDDLIHLLKGLFALDPKRRLTSTQCLSMKILIDITVMISYRIVVFFECTTSNSTTSIAPTLKV